MQSQSARKERAVRIIVDCGNTYVMGSIPFLKTDENKKQPPLTPICANLNKKALDFPPPFRLEAPTFGKGRVGVGMG
jgi:hypothetical protein